LEFCFFVNEFVEEAKLGEHRERIALDHEKTVAHDVERGIARPARQKSHEVQARS